MGALLVICGTSQAPGSIPIRSPLPAGCRAAPCRVQRRRRLRPCAASGAAGENGAPASRSVVILPGLGNNSKVGPCFTVSAQAMRAEHAKPSWAHLPDLVGPAGAHPPRPVQDYAGLVEQLQQRGLHVEVAPVSRLDWWGQGCLLSGAEVCYDQCTAAVLVAFGNFLNDPPRHAPRPRA